MVHQSAISKPEKRFRFLSNLFESNGSESELSKATEFITQDYARFNSFAAALSSHVSWIPYPFLRERIKKIVAELRDFAELFKGKIVELGGKIPPDSARMQQFHGDGTETEPNYLSRQQVKMLVRDMEDHSSFAENLQHQKNLIRDSGTVKMLNFAAAEMQRQGSELMDIVMRLS